MSALQETAVSLRFFGDDLDPVEITARLGVRPTVGVAKGEMWTTSTGAQKLARTGSWRLVTERRRPGDLSRQIADLLVRLSDDLSIWTDLTTRFQADLFCGLFLGTGNDGQGLTPEVMKAIGSRGLVLNLDIYASEMAD